MDITFTNDLTMPGADITAGTVTEMGFKLGDICCSGGINNERFMTLWGANNFNAANGTYHSGSETTLVMVLRIKMERAPTSTEVSAPGMTVIFGFGLAGMAYMRRRKTV